MEEFEKCDCGKKLKARGMCSACYERWRRANPGEVHNRSGKWILPDGSRRECFVMLCREPVQARYRCKVHLQQYYYMGRRGMS